jgi:WD40 repeat protein
MTGGYRCSSGHTWSGAGAPPACPVCGDATVYPLPAPDPVRLFVATEEQAPGGSATQALPAPNDAPNESDTSFGSLVVALPEPGADAPGPRPGNSVVEFGAGATVPRSPGSSIVPAPGTGEYAPPAVPGFEILHEVGRGGMGVVYKARQLNLNRPVALKMILSGAHAGPAERDRFRREAEAVAALQHPHIVQIFEIGEANGHPYLALEFVEGGSLAQNLTGEPWAPRRAAALVETLARTMQFAHDAGIVHRDLKPGNVLLGGVPRTPQPDSKTGSVSSKSNLRATGAPTPKVTDFGLAKRLDETLGGDRTRTGAVMGTPSYIAPEQAGGRAKDVGPAADVYALGAILYELLTGRPPFRGETALDTVLLVLHDDPVPPKRLQASVPNDLETICLKCLSKQPNKRYRTANELADDLDRFLNGEPIRARPLGAWGRGVKWARRHPALAVLLGATVTATAALVMVLSVAYARVSDAVRQKDEEAQKAQYERDEAKREREIAARLAEENQKGREKAERLAEESRRAAFALQLAQCAMLCERDPLRAAELLENEQWCPRDLRDFAWHYLRRLCQREELRYRDHGEPDPLHAAAYAPGGRFVATAGEAGQVRVWDPRTGRTWMILNGHTGTVRGIAFSPDGGALATAGMDGTVRLWVLPEVVLETYRRVVNRLPFELLTPFDPLAKPAVIGPTITLTDAHPEGANCVAFSPNGRGLVSGGADGHLRWWELGGWRASGTELAAHGGAAALALGAARAANPQEARAVWPREIGPRGAPVLSVAFAADGSALACGRADAPAWGRAAAQVYSGDGTRLIRALDDHPAAVTAVALSPDGTVLATAYNAKPISVRLYNLLTLRDRRLFGHTSAVHALAFAADGQLLASGAFDKTVRLWDADDGRERSVLTGHEQLVRALAFGPDRRALVSASTDGTAVVWQTGLRTHEAADALAPLPYDPPGRERGQSLSAVALSPAANGLVLADDLNRTRTVALDYPSLGARGPAPRPPLALAPLYYGTPRDPQPARAAAAAADGRAFALAAGGDLFVWRPIPLPGKGPNPPRGAWGRPARVKVPFPVHAVRFDPTGRWLATADPDGARLYDLHAIPPGESVDARGAKLLLATPHPPAVAFHPTEPWLAVGLKTGVRIVSFAPDSTGRVVDDLPEAHGSLPVDALAYDATGTRLATGDASGTVRVWDAKPNGRFALARTLTGHTARVQALAFSPNGRALASGSDDRTVLLWDPLGGRERLALTGHADQVRDVAFTADGEALVSVSRDGGVKRWRADVRAP